MAQPTDKQKKLIEFYSKQLAFWNNTNDLSSPTHRGDIEEFLFSDMENFSNKEKEDILNICIKMLVSIRKV